MSEVADREAGDWQRIDALQRDLQAAVDRAVHAGADPADVLTCIGVQLGRVIHGMACRPSALLLKQLLIDELVPAGLRLAAAEREARQINSYGGEARRRRP